MGDKMLEYSKYQEVIFDWVKNGSGNAQVKAAAGSGKTTTIVGALKYIPPFQSVLFLAFNKAIAVELKKQVPQNVTAMTFNAFGFKVLRKRSKVRVDAEKTAKILKLGVLKREEWRKFFRLKGPVCRIISLLKAHNRREPIYEDLIDKFGINIPKDEDFHFIIKSVWSQSLHMDTIDFDDQLFLPLYYDLEFPHYDWVFVDEVQDLNITQIEMLKAIPGSVRMCTVGDPSQAIYGFRGADSDAIINLITSFRMQSLPLSICYRCPKKVVKEAQKIVPEIEAWDEAIEGEVSEIDLDQFDPPDGSMTLCRITAPLVQECLILIRQGKNARVKGKEIGKALISLHKFVTGLPGDSYHSCLGRAIVLTQEKYRNRKNTLIVILDQLDTLGVIYDYDPNVPRAVEMIFKDGTTGAIFSTIHKAKGLESDHVYILRPDLLPHPNAKQAWEKEQERNLKYVAITRALKTLTYVKGER